MQIWGFPKIEGTLFCLPTQRPAADQRVGRAIVFYEVLWLQRHEIDGASGILGSRPSALPSMVVSQHPWPQDDNFRATSTSTVAASMAQG